MPSEHAVAAVVFVVYYTFLLFWTYRLGYRNGVQRFLKAYGLGGGSSEDP